MLARRLSSRAWRPPCRVPPLRPGDSEASSIQLRLVSRRPSHRPLLDVDPETPQPPFCPENVGSADSPRTCVAGAARGEPAEWRRWPGGLTPACAPEPACARGCACRLQDPAVDAPPATTTIDAAPRPARCRRRVASSRCWTRPGPSYWCALLLQTTSKTRPLATTQQAPRPSCSGQDLSFRPILS